jgi:hypothetical protein
MTTIDDLIARTPELAADHLHHPTAMRLLAQLALETADTDAPHDPAAHAARYFELGLQVAFYERSHGQLLLAALQDLFAEKMDQPLAYVVQEDQAEAAAFCATVLPSLIVDPPAVAACRSCGAPIYWTVTKAGKRAPMDLDPATQAPLDPPVNHFVTCPDSKGWKKGR